MAMLHELLELAQQSGTAFILLLAVAARIVVLKSPKGSEPRGRFRFAFSITLIHLLFLLLAASLEAIKSSQAGGARIATGLTGTLAAVTLASVVLFEGFVLRVRPGLPRIVPDVITTLASVIGLMRASSQLGLELTGVIATSAVLTAVIGLSLQDTLGNLLGGLALQLDSSIQVGDWVKLGDVSGRVSEIRWRYTAIETRNWETVVVPNSIVMRSQVTVLGRRRGSPLQWRRWVYFQVDFRTPPNEVIQIIENALRSQPLPNVASDPPPDCIAVEFKESQTRYAVRYYVLNFQQDDPTDSMVRNRIYYALARHQIGLSIPAQTVFVTEDDHERHAKKREAEHARRLRALKRIDLFASLSDEDRNDIAARLHRAPFAEGETITREGAHAHHLYVILSGEVSVRVGGLDESREVARLGPGEFFGEMALLTGERRRATSIAATDVECYRLDAEAFRSLLARRPDLAERVAAVLAERQTALVSAKERLDAGQRAELRAQKQRALASRVRAFFELD